MKVSDGDAHATNDVFDFIMPPADPHLVGVDWVDSCQPTAVFFFFPLLLSSVEDCKERAIF